LHIENYTYRPQLASYSCSSASAIAACGSKGLWCERP